MSGNRLTEVAEVLAHHYRHTNRADKAFAYLSMAGSKSLSVYSLDEAATHFTAALALLDQNQNCASDDQVVEFLVPYTLLLNMQLRSKVMIDAVRRYLERVDHLNDPRAILIRHHFVFALLWNARYVEATRVQRETSLMAARFADDRSRAYSLASDIYVSTIADAPKPLHEYESLKKELLIAASATDDVYIQCWARFVIAWEEVYRGRMNEARSAARTLMEVGQRLNDPRATGFGLAALTWVALTSDSYNEALEYSDQSLTLTLAPFEHDNAVRAKGWALVLLRRLEEGVKLLEEDHQRCARDGNLYALNNSGGIFGVYEVLRGNVKGGIKMIEEVIVLQEKDGCRLTADWFRFFLCEVYLQIIGGKEKLNLFALLKNVSIILKVIVTASSRVPALMFRVLENPHIDPQGLHVGRVQMILGLLYKTKKNHALALKHLIEARRILSQFGQPAILARVEMALAELGYQPQPDEAAAATTL